MIYCKDIVIVSSYIMLLFSTISLLFSSPMKEELLHSPQHQLWRSRLLQLLLKFLKSISFENIGGSR